MLTKPISFIIPCYNCESTIHETINSILDLNLYRYEICAVDDFSSDNTKSILKEYARVYPEIFRVACNRMNYGGAQTRNNCVAISKYPMIFCLDSDNVLQAESFKNFLFHLDDTVQSATFQQIDFFYSFLQYKYFYKSWIFNTEYMSLNHVKSSVLSPICDGNYLFSRELFNAVGGYDTDSGALDSWIFGLKLLLNNTNIKIVRGTKYFHRTTPGSYWFRDSININQILKTKLLQYNKIFAFFTKNEVLKIQSSDQPFITLGELHQSNFMKEKKSYIYSLYSKIVYGKN